MIITKEHQDSMVEKHRKEGRNTAECISFIAGMDAMYELVNKNLVKQLNN